MLTPPAFFIACQLDGRNDIVDIQYAFAKQFGGHVLLTDDIHRIVTYLDENGFLQTARFAELQQRIVDEFTQSAVRPAYLAGKAYPGEPGQLRAFLDTFFVRDGGPGAWRSTARRQTPPARCLIAPTLIFTVVGTRMPMGTGISISKGNPPLSSSLG